MAIRPYYPPLHLCPHLIINYTHPLMSLATVQKALARIYTDSKLRDDFMTNPNVVGRTLGLNCQEMQQLSQLSSKEVNLFANSLKHKRLGEIRKLLPLTNKLIKKEFDRLFFRYAETYLPTGNKKHLFDAIQFAHFIAKIIATEDIEPIWLLDVLHYERIWLEKLQSNRLFTIALHRFNYEIEPLIDSLQTQESTPVLKPKSTIGVWFRLFPNQQWRSLFIPIPDFPYLVQAKILSNWKDNCGTTNKR